MIDWLKKRLSPVKKDTSRWTELAEAIQEFVEANFDPSFDRLTNARSIYTAESDDQLKILVELGGYFESDMPEANRPILVSQRKMELMQKETDVPLRATIQRLGIDVEWKPLYMLPGAVYGDAFYTEDQLGALSADECLLTSRGCLSIDISADPISDAEATLAIVRCMQVLPLHIVFDRFRYYAQIATIRMPRIVIGELSEETITVNPYTLQAITAGDTRTKFGSGFMAYETIETRPPA